MNPKQNDSRAQPENPPWRLAWYAVVFLAAVLPSCRGKAPYEGKSVAELEQMLGDPNPAAQIQGAFGLSQLGQAASPAVPGLVEALQSRDTLVRQNAALALGAIGAEAREAVPALAGLLNDPEWVVRRQSALSLGKIGPEARATLPGLQRLLSDPHPLVRKAAQEAIPRLAP